MLRELRFVQGAVAKKDFIPALTHFVIEGGEVRGYNGMLALCSPIPFDIACKPKADMLVRAISNCDDTVQLTMTPAGRLSIRSGKFRALVDCIEGETPHATPEGERVELDGAALLEALKAVAPFIGDDASRPWSNGVLVSRASVFATNNICLVEYWLGKEFPLCVNIPRSAVKEMLRIDEAPVAAQVTDHSVTFHYADKRWVRTQLLSTEWPDIARVLNRESNALPLDRTLFEAIGKVKSFVDKMGRIYFNNGFISTHADSAEGACFDVPSIVEGGLYNVEMLALLEHGIERIDWALYPGPCMFFGGRMRGAIIGMHNNAK